MTGYSIVEPEVAGGWGKHTEATRTPGKPVVVHKLHYKFDGWLGDHLLETSPCYVGTETLADAIRASALTGTAFDTVEVSKSEQFEDLYPGRQLPKFVWLKFGNAPGQDDFGVTPALQLVVSDRALALLQKAGIANALVETYDA